MGQIWLQRFIQFSQWRKKTFKDRYARIDSINRTLLVITLIGWILGRWLPFMIGYLFAGIALGFFLWRYLSKHIYPRLNENQRFEVWYKNVRDNVSQFSKKTKKKSTKSKEMSVLFDCPQCHQKMRAPIGKGRIRVTCQTCGYRFERKV